MAGASDFVRAPEALRLACPNCNAPISLRTPGHTTVLTCDSCRSLLDATVPGLAILQRAGKTQQGVREPAIPLGSRGTLDGVEWEVTGYLIRTERKYKVFWREYLLFNPLAGFRWLVENGGHWTLVAPRTDPLVVENNIPRVPGYEFRLYHKGKAEVAYVLGEFYWRVKVGHEVRTFDYVQPPYLLSVEQDGNELQTSLGKYVSPAQVRAAFPKAQLPSRIGVGANQPLLTDGVVGPAFAAAALLTFLLLVLTIWLNGNSRQLLTYHNPETFKDSAAVEVLLGEFALTHTDRNIEIDTRVSLTNSWASITYTLFNETTGESFYLTQDLEFYSGVDGGESWSEGSEQADQFLTDLPPGEYTLTAELQTDAKDPLRYFRSTQISVQSNVSVWSNFWLAVLFMWGLAFLLVIIHSSRDAARWSNSDYSPYQSS